MANTTGKKHGGRKKGTPNKRSLSNQELAKELDADPLEFLLRVMKADWKWLGYKSKQRSIGKRKVDNIDLDQRIGAAKDAAPFIHAKLKNIEHSGEIRGGLLAEVLAELEEDSEEDESEEDE